MTVRDVTSEPEPARAVARPGRVAAFVNPNAGSAAVEAIRKALDGCFAGGGTRLEIDEIREGDDLGAMVRERLAKGVDLVIAAGGDGTVSAVADALAGSGTPLGILPMGTANVLARELEIPLDVEAAARLLVDGHSLATIDALRVGERHYLTQVGVGLDALMIRDTTAERKRRFGKLAYVLSAARHLVGFQPRRFTIEVDGRTVHTRASQVVVANVGTLGQPPFRWGQDIRPDDGARRRLHLEGPDGPPLHRAGLARRHPPAPGRPERPLPQGPPLGRDRHEASPAGPGRRRGHRRDPRPRRGRAGRDHGRRARAGVTRRAEGAGRPGARSNPGRRRDPGPPGALAVEVDPLEMAEEKEKEGPREGHGLNTLVAITVALLATFMALCEIKAGNVEQRMQRKQIDKNDAWAWYQARNIRQEVLDTAARQLRALAAGQSEPVRATMLAEADKHESLAKVQRDKMVDVETEAKALGAEYEALDLRDDQLDLEAAALSIAVAMLAMTALTRKRWLYAVALAPIALGLVMGLAGLLGWGLNPDFLTGFLG